MTRGFALFAEKIGCSALCSLPQGKSKWGNRDTLRRLGVKSRCAEFITILSHQLLLIQQLSVFILPRHRGMLNNLTYMNFFLKLFTFCLHFLFCKYFNKSITLFLGLLKLNDGYLRPPDPWDNGVWWIHGDLGSRDCPRLHLFHEGDLL